MRSGVGKRRRELMEQLLRPVLGYAPWPWPESLSLTLTRLARGAHLDPERFLERSVTRRDAAVVDALTSTATITHTSFFRHEDQFERLRQWCRARNGVPARIWCAGCATGEEPYSVALVCAEEGIPVTLTATDVNPAALEVARRGRYAQTPGDNRFGRDGLLDPALTAWTAPSAVRERIRFARASLVSDDPAAGDGPFDLAFCRNVLIYFDPPRATEILQRLRQRVPTGGYVVVAPVEALGRLPAGLTREPTLGWMRTTPAQQEQSSPSLLRPASPSPAPHPVPSAPPPRPRLEEAALALGSGALGEAERGIRTVLGSDSHDAVAWFLLGEVLERRGEKAQARAAFAAAAREAPESQGGPILALAARRRADASLDDRRSHRPSRPFVA